MKAIFSTEFILDPERKHGARQTLDGTAQLITRI
jgi:hypothetical protein